MTNIQRGMFLEFENCIAKVTSVHRDIADGFVVLRKFSLSTTKMGYHYQQSANIKRLSKKIKEGRVKIIEWDDVLRILFFAIKKEKRKKGEIIKDDD